MIRNLITKTGLSRSLLQLRNCSSLAGSKEKYDLFAGVLIERHPVITKELKPIEKEYLALLKQIEFEKSLKSDHEIRKEKEKRQLELLKKGDIEVDLDSESSKQTAQDFEDACVDELSKFKFAPRITEADKKNDTKSLERKLDDTLILLLEQKIGNKNFFLLPQAQHQEGETMRQTAERVLKDSCGSDLKVLFYGNAPCGFYKYKYPVEARKESVGAKVFFFRTAVRSGNVADNKKVKFEWLNADEMRKKVKDSYFHSVSQFLIQ